MKFKVLVEYEYPVEHKLPVKAEIVLHGDRVVTDNIKWIEQEPILDKIRTEIADYQKEAFYSDDVVIPKRMILGIIDKYKAESEVEHG